ncbi:hypothetical protein [Psittacid alphaherpesvirus 5]|uniref:Uncharacterized protein n=1 Tax=Psittacid alphaherpesvirus 5 TaxID=2972693 RepID=A0A5P9JS37_9ALPH|nr:hypothetical protein QKU09_gp74 [Psittacid alphaherpesvirus 5]QFU14618.1 hypothetical protein [Psittacid alphaherpesvirus 5]UOO01089.1 hypothetical protein [Psittacid alphaherpesvirus 5]
MVQKYTPRIEVRQHVMFAPLLTKLRYYIRFALIRHPKKIPVFHVRFARLETTKIWDRMKI